MSKDNPFTIAFGKQPPKFISRLEQTNSILDAFTADVATTQVYMLTGVRGSGKTVMLTTISKRLCEQKEWISVELNPETDLLIDFASKLYSLPSLNKIFLNAKLDLSLFGIGVSIEKSTPISNIESALSQMLSHLKKHGKKLLVEIDEVTNTPSMRTFASAFQIFMRQDYDVFLIMTGLYENKYNLQNEKTLTFLYRAPKVLLNPLNKGAIINSYKEIFGIGDKEAQNMANTTCGYPFAYQVLGYLKWEDPRKDLKALYPLYDQYLAEYVYDKIWFELNDNEISILSEVAKNGGQAVKVQTLRENLGMASNKFSVYRDKLSKKGLLDANRYGYVSFYLPRFAEYVMQQIDE